MTGPASQSHPQNIRIVRTPPGEAPVWVREKWAGLELPLASGDDGPTEAVTSRVLPGPRNRLIALVWALLGRLQHQRGYAVDAMTAMRILQKTAADAATWWSENVPRLQVPGRKLLFHTSVCQIVNLAPTNRNASGASFGAT